LADTTYAFIVTSSTSFTDPGFEFSFFDGVNEIKSADPGWRSNSFNVETDATGAIAYWSFNVSELGACRT